MKYLHAGEEGVAMGICPWGVRGGGSSVTPVAKYRVAGQESFS